MSIDFVTENWYLFLALVAILAMLVLDPLFKKLGGVKSVSVMEMPQLTREPSVVVDVSDPGDYKKGHISESINIPVKNLAQEQNKLQKFKNRNVVVVCRMGNKSPSAAKQLLKSGFEKVYSLSGGMAAWEKEGLPVKRG